MLVDNPQQQHSNNFNLNSSFEEFFNMDLLGNLNPQSGSSRSSSSSPRDTFSPATPPQHDSFFNFSFDDDFVKPETVLAPPTTSGFDFFGTFINNARAGGSINSNEIHSPSVFAIDPQLVGTPATTKSHSEIDEDEDHQDADKAHVSSHEDSTILPNYKVGGKGKSNRKGTVQGGGVVKKTTPPKDKATPSSSSVAGDDKEADDWRPSPEEYKKMSSKEKRQLRNKISARNFRVRRKEYITTLETDVAERDRLIDAIRSELGSTKSENNALRQEIDALKKALLAGQPQPTLPPPAPLPAVSAAATVAARSNAASPSSPLLTPNTNKDLPSSPRLASARGGFWGGQIGSMGSGFTPVHTTLVPEWSISSALTGKGLATPPDSPPLDSPNPSLQENINPAMNSSVKQQPSSPNLSSLSGFDSFTDVNPFTMKTLDMYRMHLWTRMAQAQAAQRQQNQSISQQPSLNGLASGLRPHYFSSAKQPLAAPVKGSYPTPPTSPPMLGDGLKATAQEAALASLASQTLLSKLGSAFWEAFAGQNPHGPASPRKGLDADKIRKVLDGTAVVKVVDVEEPKVPAPMPLTFSKSLPSSPAASTASLPKQKDKSACSNCNVVMTELLEEGMRSLSISKRGY